MEQRLISEQQFSDTTKIPQFQHCIESCLQCFESCEQTMTHLSKIENTDPNLFSLLNDALEITQVSATFMLRGSNFHIKTCGVCAEVCKICAEAIAKLPATSENELLKFCLKALEECSESCDQMAHHH